MEDSACGQHYRLGTDIFFIDPCFQDVLPCWQMPKTIEALRIGLLKIRIFQDKDRPAHCAVDFTMQRHDTRLIEENHSRVFIFAVATEVEAFRLRVRKDVVIGIIEIRKLDRGPDLNGQNSWTKIEIFLRHLGDWPVWTCYRKNSFEVNDCRWRVGCTRHLGTTLITGTYSTLGTCFGKFDPALNALRGSALDNEDKSSRQNKRNECRLHATFVFKRERCQAVA